MFRITFFFAFLAIVSCNEDSKNEVDRSVLKDPVQSDSVISEIIEKPSLELEYQQRDSLVHSWVEYFEGVVLELDDDKVISRLVKNTYDTTKLDTILKIQSDSSKLEVYIANSKVILINSYLKDKVVELPDGLSIGQNREDVGRILELEFSNDTLEIGDLESNTRFKLVFNGDTLSSFLFCGYIE